MADKKEEKKANNKNQNQNEEVVNANNVVENAVSNEKLTTPTETNAQTQAEQVLQTTYENPSIVSGGEIREIDGTKSMFEKEPIYTNISIIVSLVRKSGKIYNNYTIPNKVGDRNIDISLQAVDAKGNDIMSFLYDLTEDNYKSKKLNIVKLGITPVERRDFNNKVISSGYVYFGYSENATLTGTVKPLAKSDTALLEHLLKANKLI